MRLPYASTLFALTLTSPWMEQGEARPTLLVVLC